MNAYSYVKDKVLVSIRPSRIAGVGVFALQDIPEGTSLFEPWKGETGYYPLLEKELQTFTKEKRKHIKDMFLYGPNFPKDTNTYVYLTNGCHWIYITPYYFVNSLPGKNNIDKDSLKSIKFIKKNSEIISDYGSYEINKSLL